MIASRNSVLRYAAGGSSLGLRSLRRARAQAAKQSPENLAKFWAAIKRSIGGSSNPDRHVHPRHKRGA